MFNVDVVERTTVSAKGAFGCVAIAAFMGIVAFLTLFYTYQNRITKLEEQMISMSQKVEQQDKHIREIMDLRIKQVTFVDEQEATYKTNPSRKH